ncbi:hypothetical protein AB5J62_26260 [Amycolatopsis sp. cg5]|uniref:hypothetical protein n=1 Tax=Amycolatopsis sp. cg5 TaxID=3238802 RepID=UPI003524A511
MSEHSADYTTTQAALLESGAELVKVAVLRDSLDAKKDLARLLVNLRETFQDDQGRPDYAAKSYAYRAAVVALYDDAGVSREDTRRLQGAVRQQVGIELRKRLPADTLTAYGLSTQDRNAPRRKGAASAVADTETFLVRVRTILEQAEGLTIPAGLDTDTAAAARDALSRIVTACEHVRAGLGE